MKRYDYRNDYKNWIVVSCYLALISDILDGIIAQHPERFTKTVTMSENFRDIM